MSVILVSALVFIYYIRYRFFYKRPFSKNISKSEIRNILNKYFFYYKKLSVKNKAKFENRILHFNSIKEFIPRQIPEVTLEMRVLISACFVQITFGFPNINLVHFKRILIYPDAYYSTINRRYHKGEVNPAGRLIVISWKSFVEGYIHPTDSINLGLHEMAHALRLENAIKNNEYRFLDPGLLEKWQAYSNKIISEIKSGKIDFFRKYAEVNEDEFFAVAIENFFERPQLFKENLPELYQIVAGLLKQDPLNL